MERKLNVLINYQDSNGSGPAFSLEIAKGLMDCNCMVYAVLSDKVMNRKEWLSVLPDDHIVFVDTHEKHRKLQLIRKTIHFALFDGRRCLQEFRGIHFDISFHTFYSHWANMIDSFLSIKKVVAICHDPSPHSGSPWYMNYLYWRHYRQSDVIFTMTKSFINIIHKRFKIPVKDIHYIPHGRMQMYNCYSKEMFDSLNFNDQKYTFLFFGFIEHYKGLNILSEAYRIVRSKRDDVELIVAGNGDFRPYKEAFEDLKDVKILNRYIDDDEVGALFAGPNVITVLPYLNATQSGVIPIAYEFLTPIIAADTGGLREQLDDGNIGFLFPSGEIEELANRMEELIDNSEEFHRQRELMRCFREKLNWPTLVQQLLDEIYCG